MKRVILLLACLFGAAAAADAQPPDPKIIQRWAGVSGSPPNQLTLLEPAYIPLRLLETPYKSWRAKDQELVPRHVYDEFWSYIQAQTARAPKPGCLPPVISDLVDPAPSESRTLLEMAISLPTVLIGRVVYTEPVWNVRHKRVATLQYVQISQILKVTSSFPVEVEGIVTVLADHGSAKIGGRTFCSQAARNGLSNPSESQIVVESKEFLYMGSFPPFQNRHLLTVDAYTFRIFDGAIYPASGGAPSQTAPLSLESFINQFNRLRPE